MFFILQCNYWSLYWQYHDAFGKYYTRNDVLYSIKILWDICENWMSVMKEYAGLINTVGNNGISPAQWKETVCWIFKLKKPCNCSCFLFYHNYKEREG